MCTKISHRAEWERSDSACWRWHPVRCRSLRRPPQTAYPCRRAHKAGPKFHHRRHPGHLRRSWPRSAGWRRICSIHWPTTTWGDLLTCFVHRCVWMTFGWLVGCSSCGRTLEWGSRGVSKDTMVLRLRIVQKIECVFDWFWLDVFFFTFCFSIGKEKNSGKFMRF